MFCLLTGASIAALPGGAYEPAAGPFDKLPISFEENRGQTDSLVRFISRAPSYTLFLTQTEAVLTLQHPQVAPGPRPEGIDHHPPLPQRSTLRMTLSGANRGSEIIGLDELQGTANYV